MLSRVGGDLRGAGIFLRRLYPGRCPGLMMNCPFGACWAPHLFVEPFSVDYWAIVSNNQSHFIPSFSRYGFANFRFMPSFPVYGHTDIHFFPSFSVYSPKTSHAKPNLTQSGLKCSFLPLSELPERLYLFITIIRKFPSICYNTFHLVGIIRTYITNNYNSSGFPEGVKTELYTSSGSSESIEQTITSNRVIPNN